MKNFEDFSVFKKKETGEYYREQNKDGTLEEMKLRIKKPSHEQTRESNFVYSKYMNKYLREGIMPKVVLEKTIRKNGTWTEEEDKKEKALQKTILEIRDKLKKGNIKQSDAAKLARQSIKANFDLMSLSMEKNNILNNSAEDLSQNDKFNYLVSACTVYSNDGRSVFKDYEEFCREDNLGNGVCTVAGEKFSRLIYNLDEDFRKDWPEYKFLQKYGFCNDKLQYTNKQGQLVDEDGKVRDDVDTKLQEDKPPEEPVFLPDDEVLDTE